MKTLFKILFFLLIGVSLKAQPPAPSGLPAPYSTGYYRIGWIQGDSGIIPAYRDTNFIPKFQGTTVLWLHAGFDSVEWVRTGNKWVKKNSGGSSSISGNGYSKWSGSTPSFLTPTQVTADLDLFTSSLKGLVPLSGGGNTAYLRADGTWAIPPGTGGGGINQLTGDGTAGPGTGSQPLTLSTVNTNVGSFGDATHVAQVTLNGKGLSTAGASVSIQIAEGQVTNLVTDLAGKQATGNYLTSLNTDVATSGFSGGAAVATIQANAVTTTKIINSAVTLPKLANGTANTLIGYDASGVPIGYSAGTGISISGGTISASGGTFTNPMTNNGDMIYQVGGTYGRLAVANHAGMKLTSGTSGAISWVDTTAGGGGSQNLQQVTTVGATTNVKTFFNADTLHSTFAHQTSYSLVGDSSIARTDTLVTLGTSWTFGTGYAVPSTYIFANLVPSYFGMQTWNKGQNGFTLVSQSLGTSLMEELSTWLPYPSGNRRMVWLEYGINDAHYNLDTTVYKTDMGIVVDTLVNRGWLLSQIKWITCGYNNGTFTNGKALQFVGAAQREGAIKGIQVVDLYDGMLAYGSAGLVGTDSTHPTTRGEYVAAQVIAHGITGYSFAGNQAVYGSQTVAYDQSIGGQSTLDSLLVNGVILNQGGNATSGSGNNKPNLRLQIGRMSSVSYTSPIRFVANPFDGAATFPDSLDFRVFDQGGFPELDFARNSTSFLHFPHAGGMTLDGAANATYHYTFNGINGGIFTGPLATNVNLTIGNGTTNTFAPLTGNVPAGGLFWMRWQIAGTSAQSIRMNGSGNYNGGSGVITGRQMYLYDEVKAINVACLQDSADRLVWGPSKTVASLIVNYPVSNTTTTQVLASGKSGYSIHPSFSGASGADSLSIPDIKYIDSLTAAKISAAGSRPFADNTALIKNNSDNTKLLILNAGSISTGTTRTATFPDANITVADKLSPLSQFAPTTSAQLLGVISDETGTGSAVFGTSPSIATPLLTGLTSAGANDSVVTVDPTTGQTHRRSGTKVINFISGLNAPTTDSVYWGGALLQPTNIAIAGFKFGFTGVPSGTGNALVQGTDSALRQMPLSYGSYTPTLTNTTNIASSGLDVASYTVIGNKVHVTVSGTITGTTIATSSVLTVSLPFTTGTTGSAVGQGTLAPNITGILNVGGIVKIASGTTATFTFVSGTSVSSGPFVIDFTYSL